MLRDRAQQQLAWLDQEIGVFFHYTMYTFVSQPNALDQRHADCGQVFNSDLKSMPDPSVFNPPDSNFVDQWMEAASAFGARYAMLVVKHCDGFVAYPTNATFADGTSSLTVQSRAAGVTARVTCCTIS